MRVNHWFKDKHKFDTQLNHTCVTCENNFTGRYCNLCGEKVIEPFERSFQYFFVKIVNAITFVDRKFIKSLWIIIARPGYMSQQVLQGRITPWTKPLALFFIVNLIYFLLPISATFNFSLRQQLGQNYGEWASQIVATKAAELSITVNELHGLFNPASEGNAKLIIIILIPLFALMLSIVNFSRKRYFFNHLVLAQEFTTFLIFYATICFGIVSYTLPKLGTILGFDWSIISEREEVFVLPGIFLILFYFLTRAHCLFYQQKWWIASLKSIVLIVAFGINIILYRLILFIVTIYLL